MLKIFSGQDEDGIRGVYLIWNGEVLVSVGDFSSVEEAQAFRDWLERPKHDHASSVIREYRQTWQQQNRPGYNPARGNREERILRAIKAGDPAAARVVIAESPSPISGWVGRIKHACRSANMEHKHLKLDWTEFL